MFNFKFSSSLLRKKKSERVRKGDRKIVVAMFQNTGVFSWLLLFHVVSFFAVFYCESLNEKERFFNFWAPTLFFVVKKSIMIDLIKPNQKQNVEKNIIQHWTIDFQTTQNYTLKLWNNDNFKKETKNKKKIKLFLSREGLEKNHVNKRKRERLLLRREKSNILF